MITEKLENIYVENYTDAEIAETVKKLMDDAFVKANGESKYNIYEDLSMYKMMRMGFYAFTDKINDKIYGHSIDFKFKSNEDPRQYMQNIHKRAENILSLVKS